MTSHSGPVWLSAFLDFAPGEFASGASFWRAATGYELAALESDFSALRPAAGDAYLGVHRLEVGHSQLHLDVHVGDVVATSETALALGAKVVDDSHPDYLMLASPAEIGFCLVGQLASRVPTAQTWPQGHSSRVGQACLDIPGAVYDAEVKFWAGLLGGEWKQPEPQDPLVFRAASGLAFDLRLQPSLFATFPMGHLHIVTDDRAAEVERLVAAGAVVRAVREHTSVLEPPGGLPVCVMDQPRDELQG